MSSPQSDAPRPNPTKRLAVLEWGVALATLAVLVSLAVVSVRTLLGEQALAQAQAPGSTDGALYRSELEQAIRLRPGLAEARRLLATSLMFDQPQQAQREIETAIRLEPSNWRNWAEAGVIAYRLGDISGSHRAMETAVRYEAGFDSHFQLANLAYLQGDQDAFWAQMRAALAVAPLTSVKFVLDRFLSATASQTPEAGLRRLQYLLPTGNVPVTAQSIDYLLARGQFGLAVSAGDTLQCQHPEDASRCRAAYEEITGQLLQYLYGTDDPNSGVLAAAVLRLWDRAVNLHLVSRPLEHVGESSDGWFQDTWAQVPFAWVTPSRVFVHRAQDAAALRYDAQFDFTGNQADRETVLYKYVLLEPGRSYQFQFSSRRLGSSSNNGVIGTIRCGPNQTLLELPAELEAQWHVNEGSLQVPWGRPVAQIAFVYQRPEGQTRLADSIQVTAIGLSSLLPGATSQP